MSFVIVVCLMLLTAGPLVAQDDTSQRARELYHKGRYAEAEELLRAHLDASTKDAEALAVLAELLETTGRREEAFVLYQSLTARFESSDGDAWSSRELAAAAAAYVRLGRDDPQRFRIALRIYDRAIAADPAHLDAQIALGDLFLGRYNAQGARETYEKILAEHPEHPRALLGMARVQRFDGAVDAFELTEKALDEDPELVEARLLQSRMYLDLEDYDSADREAQRALDVHPLSAQAHALLAVSALLAGNAEGHRSYLEKITEIAPRDPDVFVTLAEVAARNRLYTHAVTFADRAVEIDPTSWRGHALRGVNRLRTGEIERGHRELEVAFAGDPFDVWTKNTLDLLDQVNAYRTVETARFALVMPADQADLLALYLAPLAEEAFDTMAADYGVVLPSPVRVEVFAHHADFSVRTTGLVGLGALGVCFGPVIAMDSPSARPQGDFHWGTTFWHELAHSFHMAASAGRVPRWFTEGLAVFEERRARPGWGDRIDPHFLMAYKEDRLAPVVDLNQGFMRPAYPQQIVFSYYQASLVFDYIAEHWDFPKIVEMLKAYAAEQNTPEIFPAVLGVDLETFADDYDAYFRQRFAGPLEALKLTDAEELTSREDLEQRAAEDPGDFLAHLALGQAATAEDPEAAIVHLERAKALFPSYTGADSPYWLLAQIHRKAERLDLAAAELEALTERNRAHYPALRALAEVRAELADPEGAVLALESAQYVYPYVEDDHRQLADYLEGLGRPEDVVRERRALLALDPFNRPRALYELALAQMTAGDRRAARSTVLEALEQAPNYEEALTLLLELRANRDE